METKDLTGALKSLKLLYSTPVNARHFYERLIISVSGYDNDSRNLEEIGEVKEFITLLDEQFPYWFYFFNNEEFNSVEWITLCLCDFQKQGKFYSIENDTFNDFLEKHLAAMFFMCQLAGFSKDETDALTRKIFNCYQSALKVAARTCAKSIKIKIGE